MVNQKDLINTITSKTDSLSKKDVKTVLDAFVDTVIDAVSNGKKVQLIGFGSFERAFRKSRKGRNPQTGEMMEIKPHFTPVFRAGKNFKDKIAGK